MGSLTTSPIVKNSIAGLLYLGFWLIFYTIAKPLIRSRFKPWEYKLDQWEKAMIFALVLWSLENFVIYTFVEPDGDAAKMLMRTLMTVLLIIIIGSIRVRYYFFLPLAALAYLLMIRSLMGDRFVTLLPMELGGFRHVIGGSIFAALSLFRMWRYCKNHSPVSIKV